MAGIKETKDVLLLVGLFGVFIAKQLKDGVQFEDAEAFIQLIANDEDFKKSLSEAIQGIQNVPVELGDLSVLEGLNLGRDGVEIVSRIISELRR